MATKASITIVPGPNGFVLRWHAQFGEPHEPLFFLDEMLGTSLIDHRRQRDARAGRATRFSGQEAHEGRGSLDRVAGCEE
ncbi:MAG TPA: hypothetical protein VG820_09440 [Fimbriimonadaceae bacterium]|nr:hypothetical protein [Fimbriimonadaceae bacterium]